MNMHWILFQSFYDYCKTELESLANSGVEGRRNISLAEYVDAQGKPRPCYQLNKQGIMQMLNKESAYVRYKTQQYI